MKKHLFDAAVVVLKGLLFTAVIVAMTSCPSATGLQEEEGFAKLLASGGTDHD